MTKIIDVAKRAGVAKSTVSNVLSGKKIVSDELKERVLKACKDLDYVPNFYASSLSTGKHKSNIIAILLEKKEHMEDHNFYGELVISALSKASKSGYSILLLSNDNENDLINNLRFGKAPIDGAILLAPNIDDSRLIEIQNNSIECVIIGRPSKGIRYDYIDVDNYNLTREVTDLLLNTYDKVYLLNASSKLTIVQDRKDGFFDACDEKNINPADKYITDLEGTIEEGYKLGIEKAEKNTAFITCNSFLAAGLYKAINKKKLKVGEDVGVFALGKSQTDYIFTPKLSYARQDYKLIGNKAVEMLINKIESKDVMRCVLIKSKLRIHGSIRKPDK